MSVKKEYTHTLERLYQVFTTCPDPNQREKDTGWSIKEIAGHLLDSLNNNHQRLARYHTEGDLRFPGYDQKVFVQRAHYDTFDFRMLISIWYQYNRLLLHMINHIPQEHLSSIITVGDRSMVTIGELIEDYFAHMEVHERQIHRILEKDKE